MTKYLSALTAALALTITLTLSAKGSGPNFSFAYLSDLHISEGAGSVADLEACIADINGRNDLKFAIIAGDITDFGSDKELKLAKSILDKMTIPYYIVAGNHDAKWSESGCNTFVKVFGYEHFEFEESGIKFIGSNSGPNMRMAPALMPRDAIMWLDSLAEATPKEQPVFFVNHYPLDTSMLNWFQVLDRLKRMNTQLVMGGHWHQNRAMDYEGLPGILGRSSLKAGKAGPGYNIIKVDGSTVTFSERIASTGQTKSPWHTLRMSKGLPYETSIEYPRPDYSVNARYPQVKEVWRVEDNSDIGAGAVLAGERVICANTSGRVYALNAANGEELWSFRAGGKIFSTPAISGNIAVFGCTDNIIYALNVATGKVVWRFACDKSVLGSPAIFGGKVFIGASDNKFRALELKSGKLLWQYDKIKGFIEAKPFVDAKQVVIGDWANTLYSLNPNTGKLQWSWSNKGSRMLSPAAVWPVKANNKLFFVTPERMTYALGAETGYSIWKAKGGRESIGLSPDGKAIYVKTMKDTVIAFNAQSLLPEKIWKVNIECGYEIAPAPTTSVAARGKEGKGILFVPTDKGNIIALNALDGSVIWRHRAGFALVNYILPVGKKRLLVTTMDGIVTMLEY